ncbi:hypothetical protein [Sphaerotilus sp.]|uniref:hypothetical protein n=1 Tax=Sphaerotilus sp. TaxID=2093942 RepID=UPI002ACE7831|nr:hypothetical protein [Sphaerotilus sp.]MDZ7855991.1 hypothetical protein [Sphaerotilus sp.]
MPLALPDFAILAVLRHSGMQACHHHGQQHQQPDRKLLIFQNIFLIRAVARVLITITA